jgi:hypothetical protein
LSGDLDIALYFGVLIDIELEVARSADNDEREDDHGGEDGESDT